MAGNDWTDKEIDLTVAEYFHMLRTELAGVPYNKTAHRRSLLTKVERSDGAIEFKHQNISAILLGLGYPWIDGYKPASNYQNALLDGVIRYLNAQPEWSASLGLGPKSNSNSILLDERPLWIGPPPTHSNAPPTLDIEKAMAVAQKFDVAERDARNRQLGFAGEELVFAHERKVLNAMGRTDLAKRMRWVSKEEGDGAGYDIASFEPDGMPRLIEVKTTNGWERTPFHITRNEIAVANDNRNCWHLVRLWNFAREPKGFAIRPPLESYVELTPTSFLASLH